MHGRRPGEAEMFRKLFVNWKIVHLAKVGATFQHIIKLKFIMRIIGLFLFCFWMLPLTKAQIFDSIVDPRDNHKYKIVNIGTQTWFAENLSFNTEDYGCWTNQYTHSGSPYGRLYSFRVAQTVCPTGWHLPSLSEWKVLIRFVSEDANKLRTLKRGRWGNNATENNVTGFSAVANGRYDASYGGIVEDGNAYYWTSSEYNSFKESYSIQITGIHMFGGILIHTVWPPAEGMSVRCLKN